MMQKWLKLGKGASSSDSTVEGGDGPSLLADWRSYTRTQDTSQDPEAATGFLKSMNESVKGAFNTVSQGVRELPGNVQSATNLPSRTAITYFAILLSMGFFFIFLSFIIFLPVIVLVPAKFASCFTIGAISVMAAFFALKGPKVHFLHMMSRERLPFTVAFIGSMAGTIFASMVLKSYLLSLLFAIVEVFALLYYVLSYFPGGTSGMNFLTSMIKSSIMRCFGQ